MAQHDDSPTASAIAQSLPSAEAPGTQACTSQLGSAAPEDVAEADIDQPALVAPTADGVAPTAGTHAPTALIAEAHSPPASKYDSMFVTPDKGSTKYSCHKCDATVTAQTAYDQGLICTCNGNLFEDSPNSKVFTLHSRGHSLGSHTGNGHLLCPWHVDPMLATQFRETCKTSMLWLQQHNAEICRLPWQLHSLSVRVQCDFAAAEALSAIEEVSQRDGLEQCKLSMPHKSFADSNSHCRNLLARHYTKTTLDECHVFEGLLTWLPRGAKQAMALAEAIHEDKSVPREITKLLKTTQLKRTGACRLHEFCTCKRTAVDMDVFGSATATLKESLTWAKMCSEDAVSIAIVDHTAAQNVFIKDIKNMLKTQFSHIALVTAEEVTVADVFLHRSKCNTTEGIHTTFGQLLQHKLPKGTDNHHVCTIIAVVLAVLSHVVPVLPPAEDTMGPAHAAGKAVKQCHEEPDDPWNGFDAQNLPSSVRALKRSFTFVVERKEYGIREEYKFCHGSKKSDDMWKTVADAQRAACARHTIIHDNLHFLETMKVGELKKRCSEEGVSKTGTKATLITALVHNFIGNKPTPVKEQPTPPTGEDITAFYTDTTPCQIQVDAAIKLNANKPQERNPEAPLWIGTYLFNDRVRACPRIMFLLGQRKRVFKKSKEDVAVVARVWLHEANLGTPLGELSMENLLEYIASYSDVILAWAINVDSLAISEEHKHFQAAESWSNKQSNKFDVGLMLTHAIYFCTCYPGIIPGQKGRHRGSAAD